MTFGISLHGLFNSFRWVGLLCRITHRRATKAGLGAGIGAKSSKHHPCPTFPGVKPAMLRTRQGIRNERKEKNSIK